MSEDNALSDGNSTPTNTGSHMRPEASVPEPGRKQPFAIDIKDLYKCAFDTRNLEINLFWQRANYFLVLNTATAIGFFKIEDPRLSLMIAIVGLLASLLWIKVCLGGKYWQTRWEQRLLEFEQEHLPELNFFGADTTRIHKDVENGIGFHKLGWIQRTIYRVMLNNKPSVSYSMIWLAIIFIVAWGLLTTYRVVQVAVAWGSY